jgi:hypothetical protein
MAAVVRGAQGTPTGHNPPAHQAEMAPLEVINDGDVTALADRCFKG